MQGAHKGEADPVKAAADGLIEGVGQIGSAQDKDPGIIAVDALHLHQELRLDAPRRLALPIPSRAAQRIYLRAHTPCTINATAWG